MSPFHYIEPELPDEAIRLLAEPCSAAMGGGTDLLPQVRDGVVAAERLVGLAAIPGMAASFLPRPGAGGPLITERKN